MKRREVRGRELPLPGLAKSGCVSGLARSRTWQTSFSMSVSPFHSYKNAQASPHTALHSKSLNGALGIRLFCIGWVLEN